MIYASLLVFYNSPELRNGTDIAVLKRNNGVNADVPKLKLLSCPPLTPALSSEVVRRTLLTLPSCGGCQKYHNPLPVYPNWKPFHKRGDTSVFGWVPSGTIYEPSSLIGCFIPCRWRVSVDAPVGLSCSWSPACSYCCRQNFVAVTADVFPCCPHPSFIPSFFSGDDNR